MSGKCKVYGDIDQKYTDLTEDKILISLFTEVQVRRDQLAKQQNNPVGGC